MLGFEVGHLYVRLRMVTTQFAGDIAKAQQKMTMFANKMSAVGNTMSMALTLPLTIMGRSVTKEFLKFDQALANTMAVAKDTSEGTRKAFSQIAIDLSKQLPIDPATIVQGLEDISRAGLNTAQAMEALPTILKFDIAGKFGSIDFATRQLVGSMTALGMASKDPVENMRSLVKVADTLAFASLNTIGVIEEFSLALNNYAGQSARQAGTRIESVVAALMAFRQQGIKGQRAGYRMAQVFRDLERTARQNEFAWERLLGPNGVYDMSTGTMRDIVDIIIDIEKAFSDMTPYQREAQFTMLNFQERSKLATKALIDLGPAMKEWRDAMIEGTGSGEYLNRIVKMMTSSWRSQLKILWNTAFVIRHDIGEEVTKIMVKLLEIVAKVAVGWQGLSDATKESIIHFGMLLVVLGPLLKITSFMLKIFLLWPAAMAKSAVMGLVFIAKLALAIAPVAVSIISIIVIVHELNEAWKIMGPTGQSAFEDIKDAAIGLWNWLEKLKDHPLLRKSADVVGKGIKNVMDKFDTGSAGAHSLSLFLSPEEMQKKLEPTRNMPTADVYRRWGEKFAKDVQFDIFEYAQPPQMEDFIGDTPPKLTFMDNLKKTIGEKIDDVKGFLANKFPEIKSVFDTLDDPKAWEKVLKAGDEAAQAIIDNAKIAGTAQSAVDSFSNAIGGLNKRTELYFASERAAIQQSITSWTFHKDFIAEHTHFTVQEVEKVIQQYEKLQNALIDIEEAKAGQNIFKGMAAGIHEAVLNMETMGELGANIAQTFIEDIATAIDQVAQGTKNWNEALRDVASTIASMLIKTGVQNLLSLALGGMSGTGGLTGLIGGLFKPAAGIPVSDMGAAAGGIATSYSPVSMLTGRAHGGGIVGALKNSLVMSSSVFAGAVKAHSGLLPNERPIIATKDEGIFTPGQMKALGGSRMSDAILRQILLAIQKRQTLNAQIVDYREVVTQTDLNGRVGQEAVGYHLSRSR